MRGWEGTRWRADRVFGSFQVVWGYEEGTVVRERVRVILDLGVLL